MGDSLNVPVNSGSSLVSCGSANPIVEKTGEEDISQITLQTIQIYQMEVRSQIYNTFATNTVLSKVKNYANTSQEAIFSIVLPETAFVSGFIMEIDGKNYTAHVKEKEEANKIYNQAISNGQSAAHVALNARDANRFTVSVNLEPERRATFHLKYEELLKRQDNGYELILNLQPGQPVNDLYVEVTISDYRRLTDLKVPPLRSGNEMANQKAELDPRAEIKILDVKNALVTYRPNREKQKQLARFLGTNEENGLAGQFVVQYDVERDSQGGDVIIHQGYFVHFFSPSELQSLPKHVVFVLDTSGSMEGQKITQLRKSMVKILEQLNDDDMFNLIEFNSNVNVLNLDDASKIILYPSNKHAWGTGNKDIYTPLKNIDFRPPYVASSNNIKKAKSTVSKLTPRGSTDIYTALEVGLYQVELARINNSPHQPIIIFLTDGEPNVRVNSTTEITTNITEYNSGKRASAIFTLSFGSYANKEFLQKIAARNKGFSRHIYEAADASLQFQNFYKLVSSPLLTNVTFIYQPSATNLTLTEFPIHFGGSELVVAGQYTTPLLVQPTVEAHAKLGLITLRTKVDPYIVSMERLWAYLTVKQFLEKKDVSDKNVDEIKKHALEVALKYGFVTSISSLVVVKPKSIHVIEIEASDKATDHLAVHKVPAIPCTGLHRPPIIGDTSSNFQDRVLVGSPFYSTSNDYLQTRKIVPTPVPYKDLFATLLAALEVKHSVVFKDIPWLRGILTNGYLSLSTGKYKLGLEEKMPYASQECPLTPLNGTGYCKLLYLCKHIHMLLFTEKVYERHFCILKEEYAGICCP